ncbi:hypothetical protein SNE40_008203 [Patella caerulea]|uniref:Uncharacterized protein n=1 Tax=Patella caerulea TaxID=87958 RepID=A0AAN8Q3G0_PATCE
MEIKIVICSLILLAAVHESVVLNKKCGVLVKLESFSGRFKRSFLQDIATVTSIRVRRQLSRAPCIYGDSYGRRGSRIYVDKGCRAVFELCVIEGELKTGTCSSMGFQRKVCRVAEKGTIVSVEILAQYSNYPCIFGKSIFVNGLNIVVTHGCSAKILIGIDD